jgi:hypothetical protein
MLGFVDGFAHRRYQIQLRGILQTPQFYAPSADPSILQDRMQ